MQHEHDWVHNIALLIQLLAVTAFSGECSALIMCSTSSVAQGTFAMVMHAGRQGDTRANFV
jgi:hypothetical protein